MFIFFFFSSRRRHTRYWRDWSSDVCSSDLTTAVRLYQSIYETAMRNQVPRPVIDDLVRIYSYDVDFQRKAQRSEERRVGKSVDLGGRRIIKNKKRNEKKRRKQTDK